MRGRRGAAVGDIQECYTGEKRYLHDLRGPRVSMQFDQCTNYCFQRSVCFNAICSMHKSLFSLYDYFYCTNIFDTFLFHYVFTIYVLLYDNNLCYRCFVSMCALL